MGKLENLYTSMKLLWSKKPPPSARKTHPQKPPVDDKPTSNFTIVLASITSILIIWGAYAINILYQTPTTATDDFIVGQKVPADIYAQVTFDFNDSTQTAIKQQHEASKVLDIYRIDDAVNDIMHQNFIELFRIIKAQSIDDSGKIETDEIILSDYIRMIYKSLTKDQKDSLIAMFGSADKQKFFLQNLDNLLLDGVISKKDNSQQFSQQFSQQRIYILDSFSRKTKTSFSSINTPKTLADEILTLFVDRFSFTNPETVEFISQNIISRIIRPNLHFEELLTNEAREKARDAVQPEKQWISEGTVFLQQGSVITEKDILILSAHNSAINASIDSTQYLLKVISSLTLGLICILVMVIYIYTLNPSFCISRSQIILISVIIALNIVLIRLVEELIPIVMSGSKVLINPALPIAFSSLFAAILFGKRLGMAIGVFMSLIACLTISDSIHIFILGIATSFCGTLAIYSARTRTQTFRASIVMAISIFLIESVYLTLKSTPWPNFLIMLGIAITTGFLTVLLINLLLPLTEYLMGLTTNISLLELSDLNHPILKRLQMEAPGTYHHTLMVATLSETAAEAIGANTLLTRVATYFHDIGKLSNPSYFTENSFGVDRHEDLSPRMSTMIILNHVKEGLALAAKYGLKKPIRDVIASHHGTSLVYYFYHRAITESKNTEEGAITEEDFRYAGPLPKSKESSIISLADSCEAASRSLKKQTPQKITALIKEIFRNKLIDGQLDESKLTIAEIKIVEASIIKSLNTMLHSRISYPKVTQNESNPEQLSKNLFTEKKKKIEGDHTKDSPPQQPKPVIASR